jgi:NADH dehydrogenase [ubiquinone] 1 alpha subcomplex assembly factor 1
LAEPGSGDTATAACSGAPTRLIEFRVDADFAAWRAIDDGVMGGHSRSSLRQYAPGIAAFSGEVSLESGGGFASVRTTARFLPAADASAFVLRCRGDGHRYKFTARVEDAFDGIQYQAAFSPAAGSWVEVTLPLSAFAPSFRGRPVPGAGALEPARIRQFGLMISDRQAGHFELLLQWVDAVRAARGS